MRILCRFYNSVNVVVAVELINHSQLFDSHLIDQFLYLQLRLRYYRIAFRNAKTSIRRGAVKTSEERTQRAWR